MNPNYPIRVLNHLEEQATIPVELDKTKRIYDLEIRRLSLEVSFADEILPASIISLYQPQMTLFWWRYSPLSAKELDFSEITNRYLKDEKRFLYLTENQIVSFFWGNSALWIRKSPARYKSIEEAHNKVLLILEQNLEGLEQCHNEKWTMVLAFADLTEYFFRLEEEAFSASPRFFGKILNVTYLSNAQWQIELEGTYHRKATLILKDRYENVEEPLLLTDDYYQNTRVLMRRNSYYLERGLAIPDYHYELLEVWKEGVKKD
ncbi:MAG: hypothetical protein DRR19_32960 [Candidatus Parabeggiatoa sp. nov. 1]|nr:MAG: hypothetical protein DRR19_32960 [Gammaproteobacteria bacterium]